MKKKKSKKRCARRPNGNITAPHQQQKLNWAEAKALVALLNLAKMARALGKPADAAAWGALYARYAPLFSAERGPPFFSAKNSRGAPTANADSPGAVPEGACRSRRDLRN